jgi:hypothetical protein
MDASLYDQFNNYSEPEKISLESIQKEFQIYNSEILANTLSPENINKMDDIELAKFVKQNIYLIIRKVFNEGYANKYTALFLIPKFVDAFNNALSTFDFFDRALAIRCNQICYDFFTAPNTASSTILKGKMYDMSRIVNRIYIPRLLGMGLTDLLANDLLVARYSNFNLDICVKRVNFIMINQSTEFMTEERMENIIRILFKPETDFQKMFKYHMFNVNPDANGQNFMTEDMEEIDSTMNLSVLNILESLPEQIIFSVIKDYAEGYTAFGDHKKVRFSMRSISYDYPRINGAVNMLITYGSYIP